jgi:4-hydroxy-tetrahydrodipicolinate reductase
MAPVSRAPDVEVVVITVQITEETIMVKVLVSGARGRMGTEVVAAVNAAEDLEYLGGTGRDDDLRDVIQRLRPDVVVDFTPAGCGYEHTKVIIEAGARPVIGTSGFDARQVEELQEIAAQRGIGGVIAPNFALGAVLMMKFAREAARYLPDAEIIESHHQLKKDAPSGTAIRTAELIDEGRISHAEPATTDLAARGHLVHETPIHSVRLPGIIARQEIVFGGNAETLTIIHNSLHRSSFMPGVCLACRKVMSVDRVFYGLEHLL